MKSTFTESEKAVRAYIETNREKIPALSISTMAEESFTSPATVSRTIRKMGFKDLAELKYSIEQTPREPEKILEKSIHDLLSQVEAILLHIEQKTMLAIREKVDTSERILIVSRGITSHIAADLNFRLQMNGFNATLINDMSLLRKFDQMVREGDLVLLLSVRCSTDEILRAARTAAGKASCLVTVLCRDHEELERISDLCLVLEDPSTQDGEEYSQISNLPLTLFCHLLEKNLGLFESEN